MIIKRFLQLDQEQNEDLLNAVSSGILSTDINGSSTSTSESSESSVSGYLTSGETSTQGFSLSYNESSIIKIPAKTFKIIAEFSVLDHRYQECSLLDMPDEKIKSLTFIKENSPFVFSNRISYKVDSLTSSPIHVTNSFYVSEISNMPEKQFYYKDFETISGERSFSKVDFYKFASPDKFYIEYFTEY